MPDSSKESRAQNIDIRASNRTVKITAKRAGERAAQRACQTAAKKAEHRT